MSNNIIRATKISAIALAGSGFTPRPTSGNKILNNSFYLMNDSEIDETNLWTEFDDPSSIVWILPNQGRPDSGFPKNNLVQNNFIVNNGKLGKEVLCSEGHSLTYQNNQMIGPFTESRTESCYDSQIFSSGPVLDVDKALVNPFGSFAAKKLTQPESPVQGAFLEKPINKDLQEKIRQKFDHSKSPTYANEKL